MSRLLRSVQEITAAIRQEVQKGDDPWLTISEVALLTQFHRRTLQRYVDEGIIRHDRRGPKKRVFIRWSVVREEFPQDTKGI